MKSTDNASFAVMLTGIMKDVYEKPVSPTLINLWIASLKPYEWAEAQAAFERHITDPDAGQFAPKPADIIRQLQARQPAEGDSGHPGPEEAWGMLIHFANDERETGLYTEPMRQAWEACDSILKLGDEVGARMCFLETYRKALKRAQETRTPQKWSLTIGSDVERRKTALQEAIAAKRISADYAQSLLPAPVASLEHLAGLLEHDGPKPEPEPGQPTFRQQLRDLVAQLRSGQTDDENRAMQAEREQREDLEAKKQYISTLMDERMRKAA